MMPRSPVAVLLAGLFLLAPTVLASEPTPAERQEIEQIVRDYLLREPEVLYEALEELQRRRAVAETERQRGLLGEKAAELFADGADPVVGNAQGDVTVVEFFDYRCGYCRNMGPGIRQMVDSDPDLRVVLKDIPILGPESVTAARAALAAQRQGRYADMHWALLAAKDLSPDGIRGLAQELGLDADRLAADMNSPEISARIDHNLALAQALGISGTPTFVLPDQLIPGAVPVDELQRLVAAVRAGG